MSEVVEIIKKAIDGLKAEGMNPDIILAGPEFIEYAGKDLKLVKLRVYPVEELGYDAVIADSSYLGLTKKASRRVSIEPMLEEKEMWEEIKKLDV